MKKLFQSTKSKIIGLVLLLFLVTAGLIIMIPAIIFNSFKSHEVFRAGMELVRADTTVTALFGSPIQHGFFIGGKTGNTPFGSGQVHFSASISGPGQRGLVQINGYRSEGDSWRIQDIRIRVKRKQVLIYVGSNPSQGFQRIR